MDKETIELGGVVYRSEASPAGLCYGCAFFDKSDHSCWESAGIQPCVPFLRDDGKHVIWVQA